MREFVQVAVVMSIAFGFGCGGGKKAEPTGPTEPVLIKKVSVAWAMSPAAGKTAVYLLLTDETGRGVSHPVATLPGTCADSGPTDTTPMSVTCMDGPTGTQLRAGSRRSEIIVVRFPVNAGIPVDPMMGDEHVRIPVEEGAKIELAGAAP